MKKITFVTGNELKAKQIQMHLNFPILHKKLDIEEVQSLDLRFVAKYKAIEAFKIIKRPVLVEDVSLEFEIFGRLPGTFIKWFLGELGNEGLCKLLNKGNNRAAIARVCFAFFDGKNMKLFENSKKGFITSKSRGPDFFGWDNIFIPSGFDKTWAEMDSEEQIKTSMRRPALKRLEKFLKNDINTKGN